MGPKRYLHIWELVTVTLFGKRISADVIKLRILRCDHPGLSPWARKSESPYNIHIKRQREKRPWEARAWSDKVTNQGMPAAPRSWGRQARTLEPPEREHLPAHTGISDSGPPEP